MIEHVIFEGRLALACYITSDFEPTDRQHCDLIKLIFDDDSGAIFVYPQALEEVDEIGDAGGLRQWNEEKHSRVQGGATGGQFGTGTGPMTARKEKTGLATAALAGRHKEHVQSTRQKEIARLRAEGSATEAAELEREEAKAVESAAKKGKKVSKKEDFEAAKIRFRAGTAGSEDEFLKRWNDKIGMDPVEFKHAFLGGVPATMDIFIEGTEFKVNGRLLDKPEDQGGKKIGDYSRFIDVDHKSAYSSFFELEESEQHSGVGKKVLGGNVEMYEALGIEKVKVTANIDVGGYAWARYGYVPTPNAWQSLSADIERKLDRIEGEGGVSRSSGNTMEAEEWDMIPSDQQEETKRRWMRDSRQEFIDSETESWRDSGQPMEDAKTGLVSDWERGSNDWALESLKELNAERKEAGEKPYPFNDEQILAAMTLSYSSRYQDGSADAEWEWDDKTLDDAGKNINPDQLDLPVIEPPAYNKWLTPEMRTEIEAKLGKAFDVQAENDSSEMDPPDYLSEQVEDYQEEYWDQKDDRERLSLAIDYGQADIEIEEEESDQEEMTLTEEEKEDPAIAELYDLARGSDPKNLWKIADSKLGKKLLLNSGWSGVLNLKDPESYARFKAYVGRVKKPPGEKEKASA